MVVAEVPLWVVHASETYARIDPNIGATTASSVSEHVHVSRAQESMALLQTVGGGAKKCAIYAVDVHPEGTKFATGGGDGTLRIWSTSALFSKNRGSFAEGGTYESSDSSGASDMEFDVKKPHTKQEEEPGTKEEEEPAPAPQQEEIHDISDLVRRKSDGQALPTPAISSSTHPVASPARPKRDSVTSHRLLCTLSAHTGSSVLAVRWSKTGQYLASAGDDAVVCVYAPSSSGLVGGNLTDNVEHWSRIKLCRGHTLDVVGLAWAPDDSHLVSCSLDSDAPIIVWKLTDLGSQERRTQANVLCNPYKILGKDVHTSTVKGVTFDPAGSYIASSGDDPAVCIWRAHDDWGLEKRIDGESGIFRKWNDVQELSGQTLFRRLSWSTDGAYVCSTNSMVKNKHVASTISRDGWSVSTSRSVGTGAANLVGHKQPVVVSRHCRHLLAVKKTEDIEDDENDPDYATLIALGDKRGFVTVWSTRKSRPLFKLQCSETRCTVTDLTWGVVGDSMILLVSILDGNVVALQFNIPNEIGPLLSDSDQKRVFQLRYGIDFDNDNGLRRGSIFVGDNTTPKLIENVLQFTLEDQENGTDDDESEGGDDSSTDAPLISLMSPSKVKAAQVESKSKGKKRIRPVLMQVDDGSKKMKQNGDASGGKKEKKKTDLVQDALDQAVKAASAAEAIITPISKAQAPSQSVPHTDREANHTAPASNHKHHPTSSSQSLILATLPHSTDRIHSVDLPALVEETSGEQNECVKMVADCANSNRVPQGSSGQSIPSIVVSISHSGQKKWKDDIIGTSCTAMAASKKFLAVGTAEGCLYLYGTSPSLGWSSGSAFRSHPPLVFGHAIVALQLRQTKATDSSKGIEIVVITADGSFGVYSIIPSLERLFKGTILPAMTHMMLGSNDAFPPKLARIQMTDSGHLLMILTLNANNKVSPVNPGGSLQAFVYDRSLELWMRISDSRFILSDFYSSLPSNKPKGRGVLAKMDDAVRSGAAASSIRPSRRVRDSATMYSNTENTIVTRSHCEDRLACAVALNSPKEFQQWLAHYVKVLSACGDEMHLRLLMEMLAGSGENDSSCWWLSSAPSVLNLGRKKLVETIVIPEMSKNRALQRFTNEVSLDLETSTD